MLVVQKSQVTRLTLNVVLGRSVEISRAGNVERKSGGDGLDYSGTSVTGSKLLGGVEFGDLGEELSNAGDLLGNGISEDLGLIGVSLLPLTEGLLPGIVTGLEVSLLVGEESL